MKRLLDVWRDLYDAFERVGSLYDNGHDVVFQYDSDYDGAPISVALPLRSEAFAAERTRAFFAALGPEGSTRTNLARMARLDPDEYEPLLECLNDETVGALVFSTPETQPGTKASYQHVGQDLLDLLASSPTEAAVRAMADARLSLSGAMAKIGLYQDEDTGEWLLPLGTAPSNRIVKSGVDLFPHEVVNEAMCLDIARRCGFSTADVEIIRASNDALLLSVSRYDRVVPADPRFIDGHAVPKRFHQEDFCQVCSLAPMWKYEPTDGNYLRRIAVAASRYCDNAFGEAHLLLENVLFDYLIGNCDNHLKNFSLLYDTNWLIKEVSPLYDVVCTAIYPNLLTEMGISLSPSRSIYGLTRDVLRSTIENAGLPVKLGMQSFDALCADLPGAIEESRDRFRSLGFQEAGSIADLLQDGVKKRAAFDYTAANAKMMPLGDRGI